MLLIGVGFGLSFPAFNMQATAGIADHEQGLASGLVNTSLQVGGALGLAIATAVISANSGGATQGAALLDGFQPRSAWSPPSRPSGSWSRSRAPRLVRKRQPELALATAADAEPEALPEREAA